MLNYFCLCTWKCKCFEMQSPAILQIKMLTSSFASPGRWPGKPVGRVWLVPVCQPKHPSESAVLFYGQKFSSAFYSKGKQTQLTKVDKSCSHPPLKQRQRWTWARLPWRDWLCGSFPLDPPPTPPLLGRDRDTSFSFPSPSVNSCSKEGFRDCYDANVWFLKTMSPLSVVFNIEQIWSLQLQDYSSDQKWRRKWAFCRGGVRRSGEKCNRPDITAPGYPATWGC